MRIVALMMVVALLTAGCEDGFDWFGLRSGDSDIVKDGVIDIEVAGSDGGSAVMGYKLGGDVLSGDELVARVDKEAGRCDVRVVRLWYGSKAIGPGEQSVLKRLQEVGNRRGFEVMCYTAINKAHPEAEGGYVRTP